MKQESRKAGKFPALRAQEVADELLDALRDQCSLIEIAGSLRRRKAEVSDIEIVFVPIFRQGEENHDDLFADPPLENLLERAIDGLLRAGHIGKRLNAKGREAWGMMNKLGVHIETGIPVDLFTANHENFYNYLVCRTGPSESNIAVCQAAIAKGWKWNPYGNGFSRNGDAHRCGSEREVFEFVGLPYKEPWER